MGVQTVMYVATIFGSDELKMNGQNLIILVLLLQLVAIPGAYGFSWGFGTDRQYLRADAGAHNLDRHLHRCLPGADAGAVFLVWHRW
jgi:hypothetical protein